MRRVAMVGAGMTQFGELFDLGVKDMVPMAVSEAVAAVDKGFDRADIEAAWFGELVTTDGFASGILADSCGLLDIPVSRLENACATGNDAVRHGVIGVASGMLRRRAGGRRRQGAGDLDAHHVLGLDGHDARHGVGLPARPRRAGQLRAARRPLPARVAGHARAPGDGRGEEPPARRHQPEGAAALRDHDRAGAERAVGRRAVRALRLHAAERRRCGRAARRRRTSPTATPTSRCGCAASGSGSTG